MTAKREMTLKEWCAKLPDSHLVNKEYRVLITQRSYSIMHFCEVLHTRFGWKKKSTGDVVWDKEEAIELITDEQKANKK